MSVECEDAEPTLPDGEPACRWDGYGSRGERDLQRKYQTEVRAARFYQTQMLDHLNERMRGFMASLGKISENGHIGLLMIDFMQDQIGLHVNGTAEIVSDEAMRAAYDLSDIQNPGRRGPERWVKVAVVEAYIHCAKHIPKLAKQPRTRQWGTDGPARKKSDYFETASGKSA